LTFNSNYIKEFIMTSDNNVSMIFFNE